MTIFKEYENYDGLGLAKLIKNGEMSSKEIVEAALDRISRHDPLINAVIHLWEDEIEQGLESFSADTPFAGLPMLLKDLNIYVKDKVTTNGSKIYKDAFSDFDSVLVKRYRQAGLIIAGQTKSPEFGLAPTTEPLLYGPTHNPWKSGYSSGGSSGGASAAVAAGMVPFAHASDGGGSIRIPAAACGLFGFKPTRGHIPFSPALGEGWNGLATMHAITRSVRDSAALLDISHGYVKGDPYSAPHVDRPFLESLALDPGKLRVAYSVHSPIGLNVHADCVEAVQRAAKQCEELGHMVEEAAPEYDSATLSGSSYTIIASHVHASIKDREQALGSPFDENALEPITMVLLEISRSSGSEDYALAQRTLHRISRQIAAFWDKYDIYLTPTLGLPPQPLGETILRQGDNFEEYGVKMATYAPFTSLANGTGQPSMSVPLYWNDENLPIGVCFTGAFGHDATLFQLARQLEEASPWFDKRPDRMD